MRRLPIPGPFAARVAAAHGSGGDWFDREGGSMQHESAALAETLDKAILAFPAHAALQRI